MAKKVSVEVTAHFSREGKITPLLIIWEDGRKFKIDRVVDVRKAASLKVGGVGVRYMCRVRGRILYLYYDELEMRWFAEGKDGGMIG